MLGFLGPLWSISSYNLPITSCILPIGRGSSSLRLSLEIGTGRLEKDEDAAGSIRSLYQSAEGTTAGVGGRGHGIGMLPTLQIGYRFAVRLCLDVHSIAVLKPVLTLEVRSLTKQALG